MGPEDISHDQYSCGHPGGAHYNYLEGTEYIPRSGEFMRTRVVFAVLLGLAWVGSQPTLAQQMPAAVVTDPPPDKKFRSALAVFTIPSHGVDMDATFYLTPGEGLHRTVL